MESLKQIANLFHITLDQLLSTEEVVVIAENENKNNMKRFASYIDGIINLSALLGLLLPLYKVTVKQSTVNNMEDKYGKYYYLQQSLV